MDGLTTALVDLAAQSAYASLPADTVHQCKRRLIDTMACAAGGFNEAPSEAARRFARHIGAHADVEGSGVPSARVWGCSSRVTPDLAAFANGTMLRVLDLSDTSNGKSAGHPSDVMAAVLAMGDAVQADGRRCIAALTLAYDVYCMLAEEIELSSRGWDHVIYGVIAAAVGSGSLLNLSREQMGHAIALAAAPNMALYQTRRGEISAWKGSAGANASRNGIFAAQLAQAGFAGPQDVFDGVNGLLAAVGKQVPGVLQPQPHRITRTHLKEFPMCFHGQSAARAALEMRPDLAVRDIERIEIATYHAGVRMMGLDRSRWHPHSSETADHSLPYVVSAALHDGAITRETFLGDRWLRPEVAELMARVTVAEDAAYTQKYPEAAACRLTLHLRGGRQQTHEVLYPKGHVENPMSDAELEHKFRMCFGAYSDEAHAGRVLQALWSIDQAADIGMALDVFVRPG